MNKQLILGLAILLRSISPQEESQETPESEEEGEMIGGFIEGDLNLSDEQVVELFSLSRNGLFEEKYRWPKNEEGFVVVTYKFSNGHFCE